MTALGRVVYATLDWGVHDERWIDALRMVGFDPVAVPRRDAPPDAFRAAVLDAVEGNCPILAGPLDSVTVDLMPLSVPIVGLSWGYDIPSMDDLTWLTRLRGVVVDSQANQQALVSAGVPVERITFLPWGVDLDVFTPDGPRHRPQEVPEGARIVLSLRAHEPQYRVDTVIDAFAALGDSFGDVHLVVGHSGSLTEELRERARNAGVADRTHFIGTVPEAKLPGLLRAADCYVSASEVDGTSVTLLQAMACGTPVAVSDIEGNRPWVQDAVTGWPFGLSNADSAATAISRGLEMTTTSVRARTLVEETADWRKNLERLRQALLVAVA